MSILVQDSFTDANFTFLPDHTPDVGGAWVEWGSGDGGYIKDNQLTQDAFDGIDVYSDTVIPDDQYSSVEVVVDEGTLQLSVRFVDQFNFYYYEQGAGIKKLVSGTPTLLQAYATDPVGLTKLSVVGTTLTLFTDGEVKATAEDSSLASGKIGIGWEGSASPRYDNYEGGSIITAPPDTPENLAATCVKTDIPVTSPIKWNFQ